MTKSIIDPRGYYFPQGAQQGHDLAQLGLAELISFVEAARAKGEIDEATELYECWLALNAKSPQAFAAYFNLGTLLGAAGKPLQAIRAYHECVRIKPDFLQARLNCGRALENAGRPREAYEQWRAGFNSLPQVNGDAIGNKCLLLIQSARLLEHHVDDAGAEKLLEQVIDIDPHHVEATRQWIGVRTRLCRWPAIVSSARTSVKEKLATIWPLTLATLSDDPMFQLARAHMHARSEFAPPNPPVVKAIKEARVPATSKRRLKIGYVSSDFREHAVGLAMTQVFEKHDRSKIEVFAYYCGIDRDDPIRRRIVAAAEHWVDINTMSDEDAALQIARDGVDILVDLNGYTKFARTRLFSFRPAPVQVNWFGYPATMGTPYHHYIIADAGIIPEGDEIFYSEEVARLPCYQPNDRLREVAKTMPSRSDFGLPDNAFVYCSFNSTHKLTQRMFDSWLMILASTPGSVLWLLTATKDANARLRTYAAEHGLAPERIVFAEKLANPEHLARYPLADVFLDSFPYGAHTTASDALWMGVPVLTQQGRSFAARVCASLLASAGVPELAAANEVEYRVKAAVLYHNRGVLEALKQRLTAARENSSLFDIGRLVRSLEGLYVEMAKREAKGRTPRPDLTNLEVYHEVALDLDLDAVNAMSREAYFEAYRLALETADARYPLAPDSRLWRRDPPGAVLRAAG